MFDVKPIETRYKGYRFRSRLEARWAVFFDSLPFPESWEYEIEGFNLRGTLYLPDFYLPRFDCFIEVKGRTPTAEDIYKAEKLRDVVGKAIAIFQGLPSDNGGRLYAYDINESSGGPSDWEVVLGNDLDAYLVFGVLDRRAVGRGFYADEAFQNQLPVITSDFIPCVATDMAADAAKAARFEFHERYI
jgi:hypothetical protein